MSIRSLIGASLPTPVRRTVWFLTSREYRLAWHGLRRARAIRRVQASHWPSLYERASGQVLSGPFAGLRYPATGCYPQKLLGTYELELAPIVESIASGPYDALIDIGAAEGYYVAGFGRRLPAVPITAFEADEGTLPALRATVAANGLQDRVSIRGFCTPTDLADVLERARRPVVICDVEGAEDSLLDPAVVPSLRNADMLVEVHEDLCPGVAQRLIDRFRDTHILQSVAARQRALEDCPPNVLAVDRVKRAAMEEFRAPGQQWFWFIRV